MYACMCVRVHVHVCEFVEQLLIEACSLPTGEREVPRAEGVPSYLWPDRGNTGLKAGRPNLKV